MDMNEIDFSNFIQSKSYKNSGQFNGNHKSLLRLINYIKNLPIEQKSFQIIFDLIKFYRTPIFIACKPFYEKLQKNLNEAEKFRQQIQEIAYYVKSYLQQFNLNELNFFFMMGIAKKKRKIPQKSELQLEFLKYVQNLGNQITKIKKHVTGINSQQLKLELDQILAIGLDRKLNTLQLYYETYFKNQADSIYKDHFKNKEDKGGQLYQIKGIEQRPQTQVIKKIPLCCRTFFYDQQVIKQPQSYTLQYKLYYLPLGEAQFRILKKTVCGFLNADGGNIFLGIRQDNNTKMRKIIGMQLNQLQKQNLLFTLRKDVMDCIQPQIISNKLYSICFVPVKNKNAPYNFISGRYLAKITVKYGLRNELYSYKHDGKDNFAFRTQNEVIHRQGRDILNAYRQRLRNPLPNPIPLHQGPCAQPQQGRPLDLDPFKKYADNWQSYGNKNNISGNSQQKQKKKFKQKDADDFILQSISQKDFLKIINNENLTNLIDITNDTNKKLLFLKLIQQKNKYKIIQLLSRLQSQKKLEFYQTQRGVQVQDDFSDFEPIIDKLQENGHKFINFRRHVFQFKTTEEAIFAFVFLKEDLKLKVNFSAA